LSFSPSLNNESVVRFENESDFKTLTKYIELIATCTTINKLIKYCEEKGISDILTNIDYGISVVSGFFGVTDNKVEVKSIDFKKREVRLDNVSPVNARKYIRMLPTFEKLSNPVEIYGNYSSSHSSDFKYISLQHDEVDNKVNTYKMNQDTENEIYLIFIYDPEHILNVLDQNIAKKKKGGKRRRTKRFIMKQTRRNSHKSRKSSRRQRRYSNRY
jgi:hypothetical protein